MTNHTDRQLALMAAIEAVSTYETEPSDIPAKVLPVADAFHDWLASGLPYKGPQATEPAVDNRGYTYVCDDRHCAYRGELVSRAHRHIPPVVPE